MAKAQPILGLDEDDAYAAAAAKVIAVRAREVTEHADNVLDTGDIEGVHDMRVATRRLRAALEVFEPCFPRKRFKATLREVKQLADALGERRDRDVTIASLRAFTTAIASSDRPGVQSLIARLATEQREANVALEPYVSDKRLKSLASGVAELVASAEALAASGGAGANGAHR